MVNRGFIMARRRKKDERALSIQMISKGKFNFEIELSSDLESALDLVHSF